MPRNGSSGPGFKEGFGISRPDPRHSVDTKTTPAENAMTSRPAHAPPSSQGLICPQCGGSGTLRMGDQQFRTCLDCLGQGQLPSSVQHELLFPSFSAAVSAAHAR